MQLLMGGGNYVQQTPPTIANVAYDCVHAWLRAGTLKQILENTQERTEVILLVRPGLHCMAFFESGAIRDKVTPSTRQAQYSVHKPSKRYLKNTCIFLVLSCPLARRGSLSPLDAAHAAGPEVLLQSAH